jgi:flagellar hook-associated protein FlgK
MFSGSPGTPDAEKDRVSANSDADKCDFAECQAHSPVRVAKTPAVASAQTSAMRSDIGERLRMLNSFAHIVFPRPKNFSDPLFETLTATYDGDSNFTGGTGSGSLTVNPASSTTALTTQCMRTFVQGQPFTMTATVTGASPTGNVDFSDGTNALCSSVALSSSAADCTTNALTVPNAYQLTANYLGDSNNAASGSSTLAETVLSAADVVFRSGLETELPSCPIE